MKMKNEDIKKLTEIKQYLLDPPVSFKLYDYAITYLQNAVTVLMPYAEAASTIEDLQQTLQQLQDKNIATEDLRKELIATGKKLSRLTSQ